MAKVMDFPLTLRRLPSAVVVCRGLWGGVGTRGCGTLPRCSGGTPAAGLVVEESGTPGIAIQRPLEV